MRCPILKDLPPPPLDKKGWPWTEEPALLPETMPDGACWPKISIVSPSLNQAQFIETAIRSVLLQGYPELEYIVVDGGSQDNTVDILRRYEKCLFKWVSEPDRGQSHAINKGFSMATGDILAWLNSDDYYLPGTFRVIVDKSLEFPNAGAWAGGGSQIDANSKRKLWQRMPPALSFDGILDWRMYCLTQPSCFLNYHVLGEEIFLNEKYHMQMDYDLWLRIAKIHDIIPIYKILSMNQRHDLAKTAQPDLLYRGLAEKWAIMLDHAGIEFTTKDIERHLRSDAEILSTLRRISQNRWTKWMNPLIKQVLKRM